MLYFKEALNKFILLMVRQAQRFPKLNYLLLSSLVPPALTMLMSYFQLPCPDNALRLPNQVIYTPVTAADYRAPFVLPAEQFGYFEMSAQSGH